MEHGQGSIGIDGDVQGFMHQEVVARTLTDNSKVVYKCVTELAILERTRKALLRNPSRLVLVTSGFAGTRNTLGLKVGLSTNVVAVDRKRDQRVQGAA